jgi:hypothetical protein
MRFAVRSHAVSLHEPTNALWISLHGGGGCPAEVNESQWENQQLLYATAIPDGSYYVCPRGIQDVWNMHFLDEADALYDALIKVTEAAQMAFKLSGSAHKPAYRCDLFRALLSTTAWMPTRST